MSSGTSRPTTNFGIRDAQRLEREVESAKDSMVGISVETTEPRPTQSEMMQAVAGSNNSSTALLEIIRKWFTRFIRVPEAVVLLGFHTFGLRLLPGSM